MKKKLSILLLAIFLIPVFAIFGCGSTDSYKISIGFNTKNGDVTGAGTYAKDSTVTLVATAFEGQEFVCWAYQGETRISQDAVYSLNNVENENQQITKSTLTFKSTSKTQGLYMAVFSDSKMMFTELTSWYVTSDADIPENQGSIDTTPVVTMTTYLTYVNTTHSIDAYSAEDQELRDNIAIEVKDCNNLLKLAGDTKKSITVSATMSFDESTTRNYIFRAEIPFQESSESTLENYGSIRYANNTYKVIFEFKTPSNQTYFLVFNFTELGVI